MIIPYGIPYKEKTVLALGYFDAVHVGHMRVLKKTLEVAESLGVEPCVLIFTGQKQGESKNLFTLMERILKISKSSVANVIVKELSKEFMAKTETEFLNELTSLYNPVAVVSGADFTFGKGALGNTKTLENYFGKDSVHTIPLIEIGGEKVSTTKIKEYIALGNVKDASKLLGGYYFISGEVIKGKSIGKSLGFPTANIIVEPEKLLVKNGVYKTETFIDGNVYKGITNVGSQPTVNGESIVIETHLDGFDGDLYGKFLIVHFVDRIRDIVKFSSLDELKIQLGKDLRSIR
ncbi:MAG: riboflavin biosynthesis protein RibF [Clostridia bacterium]|nr:riboflavin biosynthesis protein RibF [Clostridia bacterium]